MVRPAHFWTETANEKFKEMWIGGVHIYDMGLHFGLHEASIRAHRHALGLPDRKVSTWTEERTNYVRDNWEHSSATLIGLKLDISRNAVIGKAHRLGLDGKMKNTVVTSVPHSRSRRAPTLIRPPAPPPREPFSWPELPSLDIPFMELKDGQCKFPVIGNSVYCGHPIVLRAYCGAHARICYQVN